MSGISWTDQTWNPIVGCSKVSAGCDHCWAERMARLHYHSGLPNGRPTFEFGWDGHVHLFPQRLEQPLHWRKPRRIAVGLMGDLFHDAVPNEFIDGVFAIMALCPQHTFQILTKRPARMSAYCNSLGQHAEIDRVSMAAKQINTETGFFYILGAGGWYLSNVWLGVSCENQAAADERIPLLLQTPAAVRFISCEPLLGPINLDGDGAEDIHALGCGGDCDCASKLNWVIVGGESGPGARPCHPDWVRSLRDQCQAASVPFHFKQWGEWLPYDQATESQKTLKISPRSRACPAGTGDPCVPGFWLQSGKKAAGHLLDGHEWLEFPNA